jgi:high affinity Mn2+ porin
VKWRNLHLLALVSSFGLSSARVCAQSPPVATDSQVQPSRSNPESTDDQVAASSDEKPATMFPHSESSRFWASGQGNIVLQGHPAFRSPYSGPNSLSAAGQSATSRVFTLYLGVQLTKSFEAIFSPESAGGAGIGAALGVAGFTNLDVVRNPELGPAPYIGRFFVHKTFALTSEEAPNERGPLDLETSVAVRRIDVRAGKFGIVDFFDQNSAGSDSHLQFLNWTIDNNGAYDYAADTRGYTVGAELEYHDRGWAMRFAEVLMPRIANGIQYDWKISRSRAENFELELRPTLLSRRPLTVRLLTYTNHADMGSYREAIDAFLAHRTSVPDIVASRAESRLKYGFEVNAEQPINSWITLFARWGWNEGRNESFAYTEVNESISFGAAGSGERWHRKLDHMGAAFVVDEISGDHRRYLELGGSGFLLGDGRLTYGQEKIFETFYTAHLWRGLFGSFDLQHVNNPGYNRDRGPVVVPGARLHVDF